MNNEPQIPYDTEAEQATIGSILVDGEAILNTINVVSPDDFYNEQHKLIYQACISLFNRHEGINQITVARELAAQNKLSDAGSTPYLSHLINDTPTSLHAAYYAGIVKNMADKRRIIQLSNKLQGMAYENITAKEAIDNAISQLLTFQKEHLTTGLISMSDIANKNIKDITVWIDGQVSEQGYSTGYKSIDRMIDGLQKKKLYIVAGRPSQGKTMLSINIAANVAKTGKKVAIYSLEQDSKSLLERLSFAECKLNRYKIRNQDIEDKGKFWQAYDLVSKLPIKINDMARLKTETALSEILVEQATQGIDLMIFDYLNLAGDEDRNEVLRIGRITKSLREIAKIANIPVIACCQLSRAPDMRDDHRPVLTDLRDSGETEQLADVVIGLYLAEKYYTPETWAHKCEKDKTTEPYPAKILEVIVLKNKEGDTGYKEIYYDKSTGFMGDLASIP